MHIKFKNNLTKYAVAATIAATFLVPTLALGLTQPTVPIGTPGQAVTATTLERLINDIVQFLLTISIVVAVGFLVWGGIQFVRGAPDKGKEILWNGVIGVAIILGVGLILQTIARFLGTGGQIR